LHFTPIRAKCPVAMTENPKSQEPSKPTPQAKSAAGTTAAESDGKKKPGRSTFAWFVAGFALSGVIALGLVLWNAWSEPHYILSPRLDTIIQEFDGHLLALAVLALGFVFAGILRRRWAWIVPGGFAIASMVIAFASTLLLGFGGELTCAKRQFEATSPDRRLLVIAVRGNCGGMSTFTYTVVVRELGPSFPRQTTIFKSTAKPIPVEASFSTARTLTLLTAGENEKPPVRFTVTIERKTFRPDKVWRFD